MSETFLRASAVTLRDALYDEPYVRQPCAATVVASLIDENAALRQQVERLREAARMARDALCILSATPGIPWDSTGRPALEYLRQALRDTEPKETTDEQG